MHIAETVFHRTKPTEEAKLRFFAAAAIASVAVFFSNAAFADCPVNTQLGTTWCVDGKEWKCDTCGSQLCPILTGNTCYKEDHSGPLAGNALLDRLDHLAERANARGRASP
jgi:hypothetical protein